MSNNRAIVAATALNIGLLLIVVATLMPLMRVDVAVSRWVYVIGTVLSIIGRFAAPVPSGDIPMRARRLLRLENWSTIIFAVAAFFMFYPRAGATDWLAFTIAGGFIQAYTSLMLPSALKKRDKDPCGPAAEKNKQKKKRN